MTKDDGWIDKRLSDARKAESLVTETVVARLKTLLKNDFCTHQLSAVALADIARLLLTDMSTSATPTVEKRHED